MLWSNDDAWRFGFVGHKITCMHTSYISVPFIMLAVVAVWFVLCCLGQLAKGLWRIVTSWPFIAITLASLGCMACMWCLWPLGIAGQLFALFLSYKLISEMIDAV